MTHENPASPPASQPTATIIICTYNRAALLAQSFASLAGLRPRPGLSWEVLVVDNNSTDDTAAVVEQARRTFPAPIRYIFEGRQGKSIALNTALAATAAPAIVFTDDDVRVPPHWLDAGVQPLLEPGGPDYTGGPVKPWWETPPPRWLDTSGNLGATIAVLDYGNEPFVFEDRPAIPLGVNMAVRQSVIERVGGFHPNLGRTGKSLLGQEQAEFFQRCRRAGVRGAYVPEMWLEHFVPSERLTLRYFARWWYWKGISHCRWHSMHGETETGLNLSTTRKILGVPRYIFGSALRELLSLGRDLLTADLPQATRDICGLMYRAGYCRESWARR
jgi:glycosyltransferase involved in cell wall biosynthesis